MPFRTMLIDLRQLPNYTLKREKMTGMKKNTTRLGTTKTVRTVAMKNLLTRTNTFHVSITRIRTYQRKRKEMLFLRIRATANSAKVKKAFSLSLSLNDFFDSRNNCHELSSTKLDLVILGAIQSSLNCKKVSVSKDKDLSEKGKGNAFFTNTCNCKFGEGEKAGSLSLSLNDFFDSRNNCHELSSTKLDLVILGAIQSSLNCKKVSVSKERTCKPRKQT